MELILLEAAMIHRTMNLGLYVPLDRVSYSRVYIQLDLFNNFRHTKSNPRDLRPLRHLISVMRRHDLTKKDLPNSENLRILRKSENFSQI